MIDKKAWKYAFCYGTIFQIWNLILSIPIGIAEIFLNSTINHYVFFSFILQIAAGIYITKLALGKVFFKKYEHFELSQNSDISPKFGKINWKPAIKLYIISFVSIFLIFTVALGIYSLFFDISTLENFLSEQALSNNKIDTYFKFTSNHSLLLTIVIISIYLTQIAILKWFISKNATITEKQAIDKPSNIAKKNNWNHALSYGARYILIFELIKIIPKIINKIVHILFGINALNYLQDHQDIKSIYYTLLGILAIRISVYAMQNYNYKRFTLKPKFNPWLLTITIHICNVIVMNFLLIFKNLPIWKILVTTGPAVIAFFFLKVFVNKFFKIEDKNTTYTIYTEQDDGEQKT